MDQETMNVLVPEKLKAIARDQHAEILWAVESGSRAWGFASPDSDFDVRFIYKKDPAYYMRLDPGRDVIELPIDDIWDVSGWDLDKTLKLLGKSNPTLYEWLNSPVVYLSSDFRRRIDPLLALCFGEKRMLHHYLSTADNNIRQFLSGDRIRPKKYFYALRPVLACLWIMKYHSAPPVLFNDLCEKVLPPQMKAIATQLVYLKVSTPESKEIPPISQIDTFLKQETEKIRLYLDALPEDSSVHWDELNEFFYRETGLK